MIIYQDEIRLNTYMNSKYSDCSISWHYSVNAVDQHRQR